jgi:putative DNA methylase
MGLRKKLIEVALPLEAINEASRTEKSPFTRNHPRALHVWWARRPLAACRAVLFAQLVDDPSSRPEEFPTDESQKKERERLFGIIEALVQWKNSNNEQVLSAARAEILKSCDGKPPPMLDPFCGGGSIPLEAQRLGLEAHGSDLNPVAVLITKALIEIPPKFTGQPPISPEAKKNLAHSGSWKGAQGLAEDVRYYGKWMREEAERRIGHLYPKIKVTKEMAAERADLKALIGHELNVIAWLWARTVKCPNPACGAQMPLVRSFWLSTKKGHEEWVEPVVNQKAKTLRFEVRGQVGKPTDGTVERRGAQCIVCDSAVPFDHVRSEGKAARLGTQLMAIVADGPRGRAYISPTAEQEAIPLKAEPKNVPETDLPEKALSFRVQAYGMTKHRDLFTKRQLVALATFTDLVGQVREQVLDDARRAGMIEDGKGIDIGGTGARAYADSVATMLAIAISRITDFSNNICSWDSGNTNLRQLFARQAIPMAWDFAETNPLVGVVNLEGAIEWVLSALAGVGTGPVAYVKQLDATAAINGVSHPIISTDPPYYDNIGYADLSDFFYIWLRRSLSHVYPDLFSTLLVPKGPELVATPYRFGGSKEKARRFFEEGLGASFARMRDAQHPDFPLTLFYAFKQAESEEGADEEQGSSTLASTGWETMLQGLLRAGFEVTGTWPMRTEQQQRSVASGTNALASSVVLACRPRLDDAPMATRREFIKALKDELPDALQKLQHGSIAPVDLAQAAIGPGMAVFSRYSKVLETDGSAMTVRAALGIINHALDEVLAEQEGEYDAETRWAVAWFEQFGMTEGKFGDAETLSKAKDTAVNAMRDVGIVESKAGKVRLVGRDALDSDWDPATERRLTIWQVTQYLVRAIEKGGEQTAAEMLRKLGALGESAKDLAYRLYVIAERKKWAQEAFAYNMLVKSWPELTRRAATPGETARLL